MLKFFFRNLQALNLQPGNKKYRQILVRQAFIIQRSNIFIDFKATNIRDVSLRTANARRTHWGNYCVKNPLAKHLFIKCLI
jgi:hypothetical protein